jgi:hypothetical protein
MAELNTVFQFLSRQINSNIMCELVLKRLLKHKQDAMWWEKILSRDWVSVDGVWIGNWIYWTLTERNYK